jgi:hypothetical protein
LHSLRQPPAITNPDRVTALGLILVWLALLVLILVAPYSLSRPDPGDDLTRNTIRLALLYYAVATTLLLLREPEEGWPLSGRGRLARLCWTLAWAAYLVHLGMAFHHYHHWSHAEAIAHTEQRSHFGWGIYFSHLFTVLWTADVTWWWLAPAGHARRSPWLGRLLHGYMAFMVFNAAVVYENGPIRWAGLGLFAELGLVAGLRWLIARSAARAGKSQAKDLTCR